MKGQRDKIIIFLIIFIFGLCIPEPVLAASIVLDGSFADWDGQPSMTDPAYDTNYDSEDIIKFYWATNANEQYLYFMIERRSQGYPDDMFPATYRVYFDINDNGNYNDNHDRYVVVDYDPFDGSVDVSVYTRKGRYISSYSGNWGQSYFWAGNKAEFRVPMSDLGIIPPSQTIRMYATGYFSGDRVPNGYSDIQWSPIPIMPNWLLIVVSAIAITGAIIIIRKKRSIC